MYSHVKVRVVLAESAVFIRVVILSAHLQSGGEMFHFLRHRISITLSRWCKGHLVDQVGGVTTVTLPSTGQLASGLIDGQQWPRVASASQIDEWFIFSQGHAQDGFLCKMGRALSLCVRVYLCLCVCVSSLTEEWKFLLWFDLSFT